MSPCGARAARAETMVARGTVLGATVQRIEAFLQKMQEYGYITLRRHNGQVVLIWERPTE